MLTGGGQATTAVEDVYHNCLCLMNDRTGSMDLFVHIPADLMRPLKDRWIRPVIYPNANGLAGPVAHEARREKGEDSDPDRAAPLRIETARVANERGGMEILRTAHPPLF